MPEGAVYVGRPTIWGNPFRVGGRFALGMMGMVWSETIVADSRYTLIRDATEAVEWFQRLRDIRPFSEVNLAKIRSKDLVCWCPLDRACHADILLEIANS